MKRVLTALLGIYRLVGSPAMALLGGRCRFHPSCSDYAREALEHHSWPRAVLLSAIRLVRCGPWSPGGFDPVPRRALNA